MEASSAGLRRRSSFFRIHLSTAVVLMLAASTLLWLNIGERQGDILERGISEGKIYNVYYSEVGWPWRAATWLRTSVRKADGTPVKTESAPGQLDYVNIVADASVTIGILTVLALIFGVLNKGIASLKARNSSG